MSLTKIFILVAMTIFAIYRQSIRHEVVGRSRFKVAIIYAVAAFIVGGFREPDSTMAWTPILGSLALSAAVGVARGHWTELTADRQGRVYARGTMLTIGLFIALVVAKFGIAAFEYLHGQTGHGGFGEVLLMISVMVAFQAELAGAARACLRLAAAPCRPRPMRSPFAAGCPRLDRSLQ